MATLTINEEPAAAGAPSPSGAEEFRRSWPIVVAAMVGCCFGVSGLSNYAFGVFIDPLSHAFGWTVSTIAAWSIFWNAGFLVTAPFIGWFVDRLGVRRVLFAAVPLLALSFAGVSAIGNSVWMFFFAAFIVGCVGSGTGAVSYSRAVNSWFDRGRGTALGLMSAGIGLSAIFGPRLVQGVVDGRGWRAGFLLIAVLTLVALPVNFLWLYERRDKVTRSAPRPDTGYARRDAVRTPRFWLIGAAGFSWMLCWGGIFFLIPFLTSCGMSRAHAAVDAGLLGITSMFGRVVTGLIIDRLHAPYVCALVFLTEAAAFGALALFRADYAVLSILGMGFAQGAEVIGFSYCIARYFGLKSYGQIYALFTVITGVAQALAAVFFSFLQEASAAYRLPYLVLAALATAAAALVTIAGRQAFPKSFPA